MKRSDVINHILFDFFLIQFNRCRIRYRVETRKVHTLIIQFAFRSANTYIMFHPEFQKKKVFFFPTNTAQTRPRRTNDHGPRNKYTKKSDVILKTELKIFKKEIVFSLSHSLFLCLSKTRNPRGVRAWTFF